MGRYLAGDTIRLTCEFKDFSGVLADPSTINVKIYDETQKVVNTYTIDPIANKLETGKYFYDYTIPMDFVGKKVEYEWNAVISGVVSLNRSSFDVVFI